MKSFSFLSCIFLLCYGHALGQPAWQQKVDTRIEVTLDDVQNFLNAHEEITYTNNSPDTLTYIYLHLWPNAYKNDHTPFEKQQAVNGSTAFYYSKPEDRGYIDSLKFTVDGEIVDFNSSYDAPDITRIELNTPLLPGKTVKIATPFRVKVPKVFSRMGHTGQAYYISQWFPKPAVYDQKGWHPISYLDQGEFFSEYGSYDVAITLPANYVLLATGNCTDKKENDWMDELAKKPIPSDSEYEAATYASLPEMKTVHYHEDHVHDFAWFTDKRYVVRKDTVYSPGNHELVTCWAAFMPDFSGTWQHATDYLKTTIQHYGAWVGPYQYKTIKAVLGDMHAGGGMEYPTITIIDRAASSSLKTTIVHEGGHNWFYGMLGSMERDHAWMDEGINTFYEQKTSVATFGNNTKDTGNKGGISISLNENLLYAEMASIGKDQAIEQTSANFTKINYGIDVYYKTAMMLRWLEQYMGEADFEKGMHDYYDTWHFHHPYPEDFRTCMQRNTTKPIGWFFDEILQTDKKIDFTIINATKGADGSTVTIRNNTGVKSPCLVDVRVADSTTNKAWTAPFTGDTTITLNTTDWTSMRIDNIIPDCKTTNNEYRPGAIFHHFGIKLAPFLGLNSDYKDKVFIAPALGINQYDGFMLGLLFHNITAPENRFRFALAPMFAFNSQTLVGAGSVGYFWYPTGVFQNIALQGDFKSFHDNVSEMNTNTPVFAGYYKFAPSLTFTFREKDPTSKVTRTLLLKEYNIAEQNLTTTDSVAKPTVKNQMNTYGLVRYQHRNDRTYNPIAYTFEAQGGADFVKFTAEGKIRIDYNRPKKSLYVRAFAGEFVPLSSDPAQYGRYELNASYSGVDDYLYDGTYFGRNDATNWFVSRQVAMQEGGFKIPVFNVADQSDSWMATVNLETDLPLKKWPIRLFFDAGLIPNPTASINNASQNTILYDGGVEIKLLKDLVSLYLPIIMSNDFQNYLDNTYGKKNQFVRSLSFTFQLQDLNWLKTPEGALKTFAN